MRSSRDYPLLLASQFLSAFGDNALLSVILGPLTVARSAGTITEQQVNSANAQYSAMFFIPFLLLAPLAGFLNDRFPKSAWLKGGLLIKLAGLALGITGLALGFGGPALHGAVYLLVGIGACAYSPAKYGILPEILPAERLVKANGTVEMLTILGILAGLGCGAKLIDVLPLLPCYAIVAGLFATGAVCAAFIGRTPHNPQAKLSRTVGEFFASLRALLSHPRLGRVLLGTGLFWFCGATIRTGLQSWGLDVLGAKDGNAVSNTDLALLKVWLAVGIIVGSVVVGQFHRIGELGRVPLYGGLIALFVLPLGLMHHGTPVVLASLVLALVGAAAGLFLIPLNAAMQHETNPATLGKTIAIQNFVDYAAMLAGAGFVLVLSWLNATSAGVFLALAAAIALAAAFLRVPENKL
jgi:LPLT family lysophospholipid transporter-like MFS transporter